MSPPRNPLWNQLAAWTHVASLGSLISAFVIYRIPGGQYLSLGHACIAWAMILFIFAAPYLRCCWCDEHCATWHVFRNRECKKCRRPVIGYDDEAE